MPKQERLAERGLTERGLAEHGLVKREPAEVVATIERTDCEPGQGLAEYAILLMTISNVMATILTSIGGTVTSLYLRISGAFPVL